MNILRRVLTLLVLSLFGFAFSAMAADHISERLGPVNPYHGTYIDWSVGGVSMEFDSGQGPGDPGIDGSFFMFHTYDQAGNQINWIGQPDIISTSEAERVSTGLIARGAGELYYATNGPCIGWAPRPATIVHTGINFLLEWTAPRVVTLTLSGARTGVFHLVAANFASKADDLVFLSGTWSATLVADSVFAPPKKAGLAVVRIDALPSAIRFAYEASVPLARRAPATSRLYKLSCPADTSGNGSNRLACLSVMLGLGGGQDAVLWYDPESGKGGIDSAAFVTGVYQVSNAYPSHCDLYLSGANLVVAHANAVLSNGDKSAQVALTLVRIPDGTVRDTVDYTTY